MVCPKGLWNLLCGDLQKLQDVVLGTLLWVSLLEQGLEEMDTEVPSSFSHLVILKYTNIHTLLFSDKAE